MSEWQHQDSSIRMEASGWQHRTVALGGQHQDGSIILVASGCWHQDDQCFKMFIFFLLYMSFFFSSLSEKAYVHVIFFYWPFYMQQYRFGGSVRMAAWGGQVEDSSIRMAVSGGGHQGGCLMMVVSGQRPQDRGVMAATSGWLPWDGSIRMLASGQRHQDGCIRTLASGWLTF